MEKIRDAHTYFFSDYQVPSEERDSLLDQNWTFLLEENTLKAFIFM